MGLFFIYLSIYCRVYMDCVILRGSRLYSVTFPVSRLPSDHECSISHMTNVRGIYTEL